MKNIIARIMDKTLMRSDNFQNYVNNRFNDESRSVIDKKYLADIFYEREGIKFYLDENLKTIDEVYSNYRFDDIEPTDIVMDIGANIGAFSMMAARKAHTVIAIDPIMYPELKANVLLNGFKNISTYDAALGFGPQKIKWGMRKKTMVGWSLAQLTSGINVDFLKLDCEGAEYCIRPEELDGIRRIEAEIHKFNHNQEPLRFIEMLIKCGYEVDYEKIKGKKHYLVHAKR